MPDILIRGMKMPESCDRCFVKPCKFRALEKRITVQRHPDCPLHELPEHGDLIDRSEIKTNMVDEMFGKKVSYVNREQIINAPVIVPASKEPADE